MFKRLVYLVFGTLLLQSCKTTNNSQDYCYHMVMCDTINITTEHINIDMTCSSDTTITLSIIDTLYFK